MRRHKWCNTAFIVPNIWLCIVLISATAVWKARGVEVDINETIEAPFGFIPTLAVGNDDAFQFFLDLCKTDSECSELYGVSVTTSFSQFVHLITLVDPFTGSPVYQENARVHDIYGKTLQEIENNIMIDQMKLGMLRSQFVCGINEKPKIKNGTVRCDPLPGRSPSDRNLEDIIIFVLISAGSVLLFVYVAKTAYTFSKDSWKASMQAFIKEAPPRAGTSSRARIPSRPFASPQRYPTSTMHPSVPLGRQGAQRRTPVTIQGPPQATHIHGRAKGPSSPYPSGRGL